ncbi:MAG: heterodisulfide reductase [Nitrospirae bacterium]|nr:MAG: heterodisulfide reductase [Nitrospirota bacterium]
MPEERVLKPDINFIRDLRRGGGETLKKCYQCATCSVVCPISPEDKPFPRHQMVMAQWGLKDQLLSSPDIWTCHNCNDCSKYCPRGARPGDVLSAMRQKVIKENAFPKFMGSLVTDSRFTIFALIIPFLFFLVVLGLTGHLHIPEGRIVYSHFFPIPYIEGIFMAAVGLASIFYAVSLNRFWQNMTKATDKPYLKTFGPAFVETIKEFLFHKKFEKCEANADRKNGHMLIFYGFVGLAITTIWITIYYYAFHRHSPISLADPMKWFGNLSALALLIGTLIIISNRMKDKGINSKTSSFDWTFIILVFLLAVTGILTELIRLANIPSLAYPMYLVHLTFVFYTIVYFPYSKLAHMGYRTLAITFAKMRNWDVE